MIHRLILLSLWIISLNALAQVNLENCQTWARENYPEIKRYNIISATETCNLSNASKNWLPMVTLGLQGGWTNNTTNINDLTSNASNNSGYYNGVLSNMKRDLNVKSVPNWQYRAGVEVMQPIYDGGATALQRKIVHMQTEVDRAKIEVSLHSLEEKVLDVYFSILLLEDRKEQMALRNELLDKNIKKLRNLVKEGVAKLIDVEALEVEQLKLKQNSDIIDENLSIYRNTLSLLTGHDITSQKLISPAMPIIERPAFSQLPEMRLLDRQSELLDLKNYNEQVKMRPKLGFIGQAFYGYPGNNLFRNIVDHNPIINMNIGVKLSWDISPFYTRKNNITLINLNQEAIKNQRELLVFNQRITNSSLETQVKRLENIRQQDDKIVELYRNLRIAEEVKMENNVIDATELLSKINDEADAKLQRSIHETELMLDMYKLMIYGDTER